MRNVLLILFVFVGYLGFAQGTKLSAKEAQEFKNKVEQETRSISTIRTKFIQQKHLEFLSNDIQSEGQMFLNSNGDLKWEYLKPNKYSVTFKNNTIIINENGKKEIVSGKQDIFKRINHLISGSISGKLFDDKEFEIAYFKAGQEIIAKLTPTNKSLSKYIKEVNLFFPENESTVSKVKLIEPSGDYTFITFEKKELNVKIDPSIFTD